MDALPIITEDSNVDTNPIHDVGPGVEDISVNGELMYILIIIIEVSIYWVFLMQMSHHCCSGPHVPLQGGKRLDRYQMSHMYRWRFM